MSDATSRDRVANFLVELTESADTAQSGHTACLRHLGVAALNLATEADAETLVTAGRALPWTGIYLQWERDDGDVEQLAAMVERHGLLDHIGAGTLQRRLARTPSDDADSPNDDAELDSRARTLHKLVADDRQIARLADRSPRRRRDALLEDAGLLATALELRTDDDRTEAADAVVDALPDWDLEAPAEALDLLARFEASDFESVPAEWTALGDRARGFEESLASHLETHGVMPALRAALAFAPPADEPPVDRRRLRSELSRFSTLAADPTLLDLTCALVEARHRPVDHLRGALPLASLTSWVEYLRGRCTDFADARDISRREATNFAHYALHLVDLCDLAATADTEVDEPIRGAIMDIEDELKEFALAGQSEDLAERPIDLHRYDRSRWRNHGRRAQLADRLARLCGAWRSGHRSGPPGSGPTPDSPLVEECQNLVRADEESPEFDAIDNLMYRARLRGIGPLESRDPEQLLSMLTLALHRARQAPNIDVDAPFALDFGPLVDWLEEGESDRRLRLLETLIEVRTEDGDTAPAPAGLTSRAGDQTVTLGFSPSPELEAMLTLLDSSADDDEAFARMLRDRLRDLVASSKSPADDTDDAPAETRPVRRPVPSSASSSPDDETPRRRPGGGNR